jgi:hypothetical protein
MMHDPGYIAPEDWRGQTYRGTVVFLKDDASAPYGFIQPIGRSARSLSDADARAENVWFGQHAMQGEIFRVGDLVRYAFNKRQPSKPNLSAVRAWMIEPAPREREEITYVGGEY